MLIASHLRRGLNAHPYESERAQKLIKEKIFHLYPGRVSELEVRENCFVMNQVAKNAGGKLQSSGTYPPTPLPHPESRNPEPGEAPPPAQAGSWKLEAGFKNRPVEM
jgi:hypothetical protein